MRLGDIAPNFQAQTTHGPIDFHSWMDSHWTILFSHPEDFTPVCTTELGAIARSHSEFTKRKVKIIALSINSIEDHHAWIRDINETQNCCVEFPIISDLDRRISILYNMLDQQDKTNVDKNGMPLTVRSVFVIDPKRVIRLIITYPASCGRNFDEIFRVVDSLMLSDRIPVTTPANWKQGDDVIIHPGVCDKMANELFPGHKVIKPYLRMTQLK